MSTPEGITSTGIAFLVTAWIIITGLVTFCFWRILGKRPGGGDR